MHAFDNASISSGPTGGLGSQATNISLSSTSAPGNGSSSGNETRNCFTCFITFHEVQVFHWPVITTNTWCLTYNHSTTDTYAGTATPGALLARKESTGLGIGPSLPITTNTVSINSLQSPASSPSLSHIANLSALWTLSHSFRTTAHKNLADKAQGPSSSSLSLHHATVTVPAGQPKSTTNDISLITPGPSLPSFRSTLLRAREYSPVNNLQGYALGPDGINLCVQVAICIKNIKADLMVVPRLQYTSCSILFRRQPLAATRLVAFTLPSFSPSRKMSYLPTIWWNLVASGSTLPTYRVPHQAILLTFPSPILLT